MQMQRGKNLFIPILNRMSWQKYVYCFRATRVKLVTTHNVSPKSWCLKPAQLTTLLFCKGDYYVTYNTVDRFAIVDIEKVTCVLAIIRVIMISDRT